MKWPRLAFVAAPEPDAEVRFEFQDDFEGTFIDRDAGLSLGTPQVVGDLDGIGVEYSLREIAFTVTITGSKSHALRVQSALAREVLRRTNWLLVQVSGMSTPVWFQTWRPAPGDLSFEFVHGDGDSDDRWHIAVTIPAEPFAVGERVILSAVTVTNDPAAASNPCSLVVPAQPGDASCPLRVDVAWSASRDGYRSLVAASPDRSAPIVWLVGSGDAWAAGPATGAPVARANTSGGDARLFVATTASETVVSGVMPAIRAGAYKVLARVLRETTDGEFRLRLSSRYRGGALSVTGPEVQTSWGATAADHATWVDLGEHAFPVGQSVDPGTVVAPDASLTAWRTSGTGGFYLDAFVLVPVGEDDRTLFLSRTYGPGVGETERVDGEVERTAHLSNGAPVGMVAPTTRGGFPVMVPGVPTLVSLLAQTKTNTARHAGAETPDRVADTATVTVSYQPRWLWIGED